MRTSEKRKTDTASTYLERINLAIDYIVVHLSDPLRLQQISRAARLSRFHFHRVFQAIVGETPSDYVKRLRLDKALRMMAHSRGKSLTAIALECGFSSSSDFSRSFKQRFNVPPKAFDIAAWRTVHANDLQATVDRALQQSELGRLPPRRNPDQFKVKIREMPARTVAYIPVVRPYQGDGVLRAAERLVEWAERYGFAHCQWLGYQWEDPEITPLKDCRYYVAVEAGEFKPKGEIGRFKFPAMNVAQLEIRGGLDLELRGLQWLYGDWLPRSGFVPDDFPCFESWIGLPFSHGTEHFELAVQLPIRRA